MSPRASVGQSRPVNLNNGRQAQSRPAHGYYPGIPPLVPPTHTHPGYTPPTDTTASSMPALSVSGVSFVRGALIRSPTLLPEAY